MKRQSWLFEYEERGGHTHVTVRCGVQDHSRPKLGDLIFDNDQWRVFRFGIQDGLSGLGADAVAIEFRQLDRVEPSVVSDERLRSWAGEHGYRIEGLTEPEPGEVEATLPALPEEGP